MAAAGARLRRGRPSAIATTASATPLKLFIAFPLWKPRPDRFAT